jgi:hypothetical protein
MLCSLAGQNESPIPIRLLAPIDCLFKNSSTDEKIYLIHKFSWFYFGPYTIQ